MRSKDLCPELLGISVAEQRALNLFRHDEIIQMRPFAKQNSIIKPQ